MTKAQNVGNNQSVFGAAPSLATMEDINRLTNNNKKVFRGAKYIYYFRVYYPYFFPALFLIFMIVALTGWSTVEGNLVLGSILSLLSGLSVLVSYIMIIPWRKHPSSLILYRSLTSIVFSVNIILNAISVSSRSCRSYAIVTQIMLLAGEGWLSTIALDLVYSLTNPFTSYKGNLRRYHILVWGFTGFISFVFYFDTSCQGSFEQGICWINVTSPSSPCLWGYYLFWILCLYLFNIWASIFAYLRLQKGLPATFEIRKQCALETFKCLTAYAVYLSIVMLFFIIISSGGDVSPNSSMDNFSRFLLFVIANKGSVDGAVWFMLHDFVRDEGKKDGVALVATSEAADDALDIEVSVEAGRSRKSSLCSNASQDDAESEQAHPKGRRKRTKSQVNEGLKEVQDTIKGLADLAIAEFDEADLSPQVNTALRQQIVQYVTKGVHDAVRQSNFTKPPLSMWEKGFGRAKDPAMVQNLPVMEFLLDDEYRFKAFAPELFRELRLNEGIEDDFYLKVLSSTANERLSEGASGAFMFFCGGGEFIVKTLKGGEPKVLHASLHTYVEYLRQNKSSLLCRFLGSYSLSMYSQTFYFVVMRNCFDPSAFINERFDIKGSWVGRSADPVKPSKKVVCRHCNTYFVPARREECPAVVGRHEASVVLKDNDLHIKISLKAEEAERIAHILKQDSNLLGQLGVLDYSLLIGVKKWKFSVDVSDEELGLIKPPPPAGCGNERDSTFKAASVAGPAVYYFGIVDFLQDWTIMKRIERAAKIYIMRKDPEGLSVNHPDPYMLRFQAKMDQIFDIKSASSSGDTTGPPFSGPGEPSSSDVQGSSSIIPDPSGHRQTVHDPSQRFPTVVLSRNEVLNPLMSMALPDKVLAPPNDGLVQSIAPPHLPSRSAGSSYPPSCVSAASTQSSSVPATKGRAETPPPAAARAGRSDAAVPSSDLSIGSLESHDDDEYVMMSQLVELPLTPSTRTGRNSNSWVDSSGDILDFDDSI